MHELVAGGVTVIVSTAYLDEAERCDRLTLLHRGRSAMLDTPAALQQRLHGQVLALRADDPRAACERLRRHPAVRSAVLFGDTVHLTLSAGGRGGGGWPAARADLVAGGVQVLEEGPVEPSLEDVFIDLVQGGGDAG